MKFIKVTNPHSEDIKATFEGETYTIEAGGSGQFPEDVANYMLFIYGFLTLSLPDEAGSLKKDEKIEPAKKKTVGSKNKTK